MRSPWVARPHLSARSALLLAFGAFAQGAPHRVVAHPPAPSDIYAILVTPDGKQVYVADGAGLALFDGARYTPVAGFPREHGVQYLATTPDGILWAAGEEKGLIRFDPARGEARMVLAPPVMSLSVVGTRVFARRYYSDLHVLDAATPGTEWRRLPPVNSALNPSTLTNHAWLSTNNEAYRIAVDTLTPEPVGGLPAQYTRALPDGQGRIWTAHPEGVRAWKEGREVAFVPGSVTEIAALKAGRNGQVWFADHRTVRGLNPPVEFPLQEPYGETGRPRALHEAANGHVWVSDERRLWELIPDPAWEQWPLADFAPGATPVQLFRNTRQELILLTEKTLYRLDEKSRTWIPLAPEPRFYYFALPLPDGTLLAAVRDAGLLRLDGEGRAIGNVPGSEDPFFAKDFRALAGLPGSAEGTVAVGNRMGFFHWTTATNRLRLEPTPGVDNPGAPDRTQFEWPNAVDFATDRQGRLWMGYTAGIARWDPAATAWVRLATNSPLEKVRSLTFGVDENDIWVAHRQDTHFSRVRNGALTRFDAAAGYTPRKTLFLKRDSRGWIWRGTEEGVYISDGRATDPLDWIFLQTRGESRIYGFHEDPDGSVWIAAVNGVTHVRPGANWFRRHATPPSPPLVLADGREWIGGAALPEAPHRLRFEFATRGLGHFNGSVQYRLLGRHSDWRWAPAAEFEYPDVAPGRYRLEVRQAGYTGTLTRDLTVGAGALPAMVPSPWWLLGPLALVGGWAAIRRERLGYQVGKARALLHHWWTQDPRGEREPSDLTGRVLKQRYRLRRLLSTGGFSQVYEAEDLEANGARVAVKLLSRRAGEAATTRELFTKEIAALRMTDHPGVVTLLDSWINPSGEPCLAMPLLEGFVLRERIVAGVPWEAGRAARLVMQLADALSALHRAGVIHRDFKPENVILVGGEERPVVIDFGSSGLLGSGEPASTTRVLSGSIDYLAPERLVGAYSSATDVYALGAVAYELLTGQRWAAGQRKGSEALGADTAALLEASLHPSAEARPRDCREWAAQLAATLEGDDRLP